MVLIAELEKEKKMSDPFLQFGSDVEGCDDAIMDLIRLAEIDEKAFNDVADLIAANLSKARKEHNIHTCMCGAEATINDVWCSACFPDTGR